MGGFHIVLCMIQTVYSRFKYAGIVELLSAAGLGGKWSIIKALKGGDTKEIIYLCKFLFEALLWYKVEYLRSTQPECLTLLVHLEELAEANIDMMLDKSYIKDFSKVPGDMA